MDDDFQEEMSQRGDGIEALEDAFYRCAGDFKPGDVIGLDDGTLWRNEGEGWKQLPQIHWPTRMKQQQKRIM